VTLDYARYNNLHSEVYTNAFLPYKNAYLYRHGPSEVTAFPFSPSIDTLLSTPSSSTLVITATTLAKPPTIATDPSRYQSKFIHRTLSIKIVKWGQFSSRPSSRCPVQLFVVDVCRETVLGSFALDLVVVVHFYHLWQQVPAEGLDSIDYVGN
jgi:hypothetical protein